MSFEELKVVVMPTGLIELEWVAISGKIDNRSFELQKELYEQFQSHPRDWFLFLAFCDQESYLSPSLNFWRNLAGLFAHKLSLTPDIEDVREELSIDLEEEELEIALESIPPMVGAEYIDSGLIESVWSSLNETLTENLRTFDGTVADFIHGFRKDIHLPGRVYFHLVENKRGKLPFAFLATYSTRLNTDGKSRHLPLKYALEEYADNNEKLLELLITVTNAARRSELIAELMESGELFHPLSWDAPEAFVFFAGDSHL